MARFKPGYLVGRWLCIMLLALWIAGATPVPHGACSAESATTCLT